MTKPGKMLFTLLKSLGKKPATVRYPFVKQKMPENFRGKIQFDYQKCIGCKLCMKDCPANAIIIEKVADKKFEAIFDLDKCIYCAQCVDSCPKKALAPTPDFELAQLSKDKLKIKYKNIEALTRDEPQQPSEKSPSREGSASTQN
jgi:formate hydrogenlyase subunit 6/NADH:ubiquinone oxidoreductase subunit I